MLHSIYRPTSSTWEQTANQALERAGREERIDGRSLAERRDEAYRQETLKQELKARKKELQDAQRRQRDNLKRQIQRAQSRISAAERKQRTRRLILLGSYLEHVTGDDPGKRDSLMQELDVFLERDRDRELFDLPHKENENGTPD